MGEECYRARDVSVFTRGADLELGGTVRPVLCSTDLVVGVAPMEACTAADLCPRFSA